MIEGDGDDRSGELTGLSDAATERVPGIRGDRAGRRGSPRLCPARHLPQPVAACLSITARRILSRMATKSRESIYGGSIRAASDPPSTWWPGER
jgi:hypothetical protein